jgi:hypothetical protein
MNHCLDALMVGVLHGTKSSGFAYCRDQLAAA